MILDLRMQGLMIPSSVQPRVLTDLKYLKNVNLTLLCILFRLHFSLDTEFTITFQLLGIHHFEWNFLKSS